MEGEPFPFFFFSFRSQLSVLQRREVDVLVIASVIRGTRLTEQVPPRRYTRLVSGRGTHTHAQTHDRPFSAALVVLSTKRAGQASQETDEQCWSGGESRRKSLAPNVSFLFFSWSTSLDVVFFLFPLFSRKSGNWNENAGNLGCALW